MHLSRPFAALAALVVASVVLAGCERQAAAAADAAAPAPALPATALRAGDTALVVVAESLVPENIVRIPGSGAILAGSLTKNTIYRLTSDGAAEPWSPPDLGGSVVGMKADTGRGILWAGVVVRDSAGVGRGDLVALDLATGQVEHRVAPADSATPPHLINDVVLAGDGTLYATDSEGRGIYQLKPRGWALERIYTGKEGEFDYPNGIALGAGDSLLYVAAWEGLFVHHRASGETRPLAMPAGMKPVESIDGMYAVCGGLVAIQNVPKVASRVVAIRLAPDGRSVRSVETLQENHPAFDAPTTGFVEDGTLIYIANSQIPAWLQQKPLEREAVILRQPLPKWATECGSA